jgi:hypothetical protein
VGRSSLKWRQRFSEFPIHADFAIGVEARGVSCLFPTPGRRRRNFRRETSRCPLQNRKEFNEKTPAGGKDSRNFRGAEQPVARLWKPPSAAGDLASMMMNEKQPMEPAVDAADLDAKNNATGPRTPGRWGRSCGLQPNAATIQNRRESHETIREGKDSRNFFRPRRARTRGHEGELARGHSF